MLYCSNSSCSNPFNPDDNKFCIQCGQPLTPLFRNRFRVIRLLGEGGFSKTYEARDMDRMDEPCVIKQFVPQVHGTVALEKATELFKQEAKRLYDLGEHPQIPRLIDYFEQDKRLYLVQELIEGQTLLEELQQQGAFNEEKIKQILSDLLPVLKFIHERGVIHRDIKPENIMRRQDGKLILIDFGVSKQVTGTTIGQTGTTVGTIGYAPMEQMRGQVFPASDLYSLGLTGIRLLTQCFPNEIGTDKLYDALNDYWLWKENLPEGIKVNLELEKILDKLIKTHIKERYQSVDEVLAELKKLDNSPIPLIGTWCGKSNSRNHILITLYIANQNGNSFNGNLYVRNIDVDWTYHIKVIGETNTTNNQIIVEESSVLSEHWWWSWQLGRSKAKIYSSDNVISGRRDDRRDSDSFYLEKVDYKKLIKLLEAGYWKDADRETGSIILKISCREKDGWLNSDDIKRLPRQDICKINELWLHYSNGRFGFSVQKRIWLDLQRDWIKVGDHFGWRSKNRWKKYSELEFNIYAKEGNLPTFWGGEGRKLIFGYSGVWEDFFSHIIACGL
ncbi:MAG TPA: GUN4 domain-containing protein [Nostocaceae cyanobacterium]|nr:GUN4 domain-containing protein [Nostocaceae cyanobacterium]